MGDRNVEKEKSEDKVGYLYQVKRKGYKRAAEEVKQRVKPKTATLRQYKNRVTNIGKTGCSNLIPGIGWKDT